MKPGSRGAWGSRRWTGGAALIGLLAVAACTRSSVPVAITPGQTPALATPGVVRTGVPFGFGEPSALPYAVAWVPEGESLAVRVPAGISGTAIAQYAYDD